VAFTYGVFPALSPDTLWFSVAAFFKYFANTGFAFILNYFWGSNIT